MLVRNELEQIEKPEGIFTADPTTMRTAYECYQDWIFDRQSVTVDKLFPIKEDVNDIKSLIEEIHEMQAFYEACITELGNKVFS